MDLQDCLRLSEKYLGRLKIRKRQKTRNSYNFKMSHDLGTWEQRQADH